MINTQNKSKIFLTIIGILLVANKNNPLVEFALGSIDNLLFVSKYLLELPPKAQLTHFIQNELKNL